MLEFREKSKEGTPKNLDELIKTITPPKGVKTKRNVERSELLDCEGEEMDPSEDMEIDYDQEETETKSSSIGRRK